MMRGPEEKCQWAEGEVEIPWGRGGGEEGKGEKPLRIEKFHVLVQAS